MRPVESRLLTDAELREIVIRSELEWGYALTKRAHKIGLRRACRDREMLVNHILCLSAGGSANTDPVAGRVMPRGEPANAADAKAVPHPLNEPQRVTTPRPAGGGEAGLSVSSDAAQ